MKKDEEYCLEDDAQYLEIYMNFLMIWKNKIEQSEKHETNLHDKTEYTIHIRHFSD